MEFPQSATGREQPNGRFFWLSQTTIPCVGFGVAEVGNFLLHQLKEGFDGFLVTMLKFRPEKSWMKLKIFSKLTYMTSVTKVTFWKEEGKIDLEFQRKSGDPFAVCRASSLAAHG